MKKVRKKGHPKKRRLTWRDVQEILAYMGRGLSPRGYMLYLLLNLVCGIVLMARGVNFFSLKSYETINNSVLDLLLLYGGFALGLFGLISLFKESFATIAWLNRSSISIQHEILLRVLENDVTELIKENMK